MTPDDYVTLFRMFAIGVGGMVIVFAVSRHLSRQRDERRRERAREWRAAQSKPIKTLHPLDEAFLAHRELRKLMNGEEL